MPIYEYECQVCECVFEKLVFKGEEESVTCPSCGQKQVKKQVSCASFINASGAGGSCAPSAPKGFS
ncbi:MAG TPA: zinc ribbon domain-containing protein [Desulfatirhabdiaceae bacterium]|nr:zinc ribbon domain-containing protein [Desulfatirhabdiaceae bacterium]